jgi:hypothetical protein
MEVGVLDLLSLRLLPTGRRRYSAKRTKELANPEKEAELIALCDEVLAHDEQTAELIAARATERASTGSKPKAPSIAVKLDNQIDRTLSAIDSKVAQEVEAFEPESAEVAELERLRTYLFPGGVGTITKSAHVVAVGLVSDVLKRAAEKKSALDAAGAGKLVTRLQDLHTRFEAAVGAEKNKGISADTVRSATAEGNRLLRDVVVHILNLTRKVNVPQVLARRQVLLGPILEQNEVMFRYNRQNRKATDVDPATGAEVEADDEGE